MKKLQKTQYYLGIDVSKPYFDLSLMKVVEQQKHDDLTERFENTPEGIKSFHQFLKKTSVSFDDQTLLVLENTGVYHRLLWGFCTKHNLPICIGNATHIKWGFGLVRGKNDVIDSKRLCNYAHKHADEIKASEPLNPILVELKDLMTARSRLLQQKNQIATYLGGVKTFQ